MQTLPPLLAGEVAERSEVGGAIWAVPDNPCNVMKGEKCQAF
ncbi:MAG: hypothetical protein U0L88_03040 [Acutalibacteraceae bacterium]|nr:hypothetical protein [Acutalibacteraceae bacterium]